MSGFVNRENQIFEVLQGFNDENLEFVVVGGYAVSAHRHRFSVDADLVIRDGDLDSFVEILESNGFAEAADRDLDVYGGRYLAFEKDLDLPVTIDLLVNSLVCRQTDATWRYEYFRNHSTTAEIEGSERRVTVRIPERELLIAVKLHSGRRTDARDVVALATGIDLERVTHHLGRGDSDRLQDSLENVLDTISSDDFEDSFKGVFSRQELPEGQIESMLDFIRSRLRNGG